MADSSVQQDYCTHHPQISHLLRFISLQDSLFKRMAPGICQGEERPTPDDTTDQFFHFFRSASLLLLSVQFQHLEAMCQSAKPQGMFEKSHWLIQGVCTDSWLPAFWPALLLVLHWCVLTETWVSVRILFLSNVNHQFLGVGGWVGDDSSIPGVIEVCGIDETPTLMSFSQLIHRFTCKWLLKGYWLRLPSACTYHANVMLSDTYTLNTLAEISGFRNRKTGEREIWLLDRW